VNKVRKWTTPPGPTTLMFFKAEGNIAVKVAC